MTPLQREKACYLSVFGSNFPLKKYAGTSFKLPMIIQSPEESELNSEREIWSAEVSLYARNRNDSLNFICIFSTLVRERERRTVDSVVTRRF